MKFFFFLLLFISFRAQAQLLENQIVLSNGNGISRFNFKDSAMENFSVPSASTFGFPIIQTAEPSNLTQDLTPFRTRNLRGLVSPGAGVRMTYDLCESNGSAPANHAAQAFLIGEGGESNCRPVPQFNSGLNYILGISADLEIPLTSCSKYDGYDLRPLELPYDRQFCVCRKNFHRITSTMPSPAKLKQPAIEASIRTFLSEIQAPILHLKSTRGYVPKDRDENVCDLATMSAKLDQLAEGGQLPQNSFCSNDQCRQGREVFDRSLLKLAGVAPNAGPREITAALALYSSKNRGTIMDFNGREEKSCLLNPRSNNLAAMLPIKSQHSPDHKQKLVGHRDRLADMRQRMGTCSEISQITAFRGVSENDDALVPVFTTSPILKKLFRTLLIGNEAITPICLAAKKALQRAVDLYDVQIAHYESGDLSAAYADLEEVQTRLNLDIKEIPESIIQDADDDLHASCKRLEQKMLQISCSNTHFAADPSMAMDILNPTNFKNHCPDGKSLKECQDDLICNSYSNQKVGFLSSLTDSGPAVGPRVRSDFRTQTVNSVAYLCNGFMDFVRSHPKNPCPALNSDPSCFDLNVLGNEALHKEFLGLFSEHLDRSPNPEEKNRATFFKSHKDIGVNLVDKGIQNAAVAAAENSAERMVYSQEVGRARKELGSNASEAEILSKMADNQKISFDQAKTQFMSSKNESMTQVSPTKITEAANSQPNRFIQNTPAGPSNVIPTKAFNNPLPQAQVVLPQIPSPSSASEISGLREEVAGLRKSINQNSQAIDITQQAPTVRRTQSRSRPQKESVVEAASVVPIQEVSSVASGGGFQTGSGPRRRPASLGPTQSIQPQVQAQAFTPPAGSVVYNSVAEAVTSLDQARIQGGGQLKLRAAGSGAQTSRGGVPLDQILTVSVMDASNVEQVLEGIRAQFNSQILAENEVKFVEVRDGGKSTIYKVQKVNGELVIEEAVSPEEVASGVLIETSQRQPRVVRFTLSGLSSRLNEAIQRD